MLSLFLKLRLCSYKIAINYLSSPFFYAIYLFIYDHIIMYTINITGTLKKMKVNELRDFIFEIFRFSKENSYYSMKYQKKKDLQLFATKLTEKN